MCLELPHLYVTKSFVFFDIYTALWNPQYVIPMCGMLLGNTINGIGLSVNNMATQVMEGGRREIELCLSFGATGLESVRRLMKDAITVGVTPMVNQLNVIGLVSIPGKFIKPIFFMSAPSMIHCQMQQRYDDWSDTWRCSCYRGSTLSNPDYLVDWYNQL